MKILFSFDLKIPSHISTISILLVHWSISHSDHSLGSYSSLCIISQVLVDLLDGSLVNSLGFCLTFSSSPHQPSHANLGLFCGSGTRPVVIWLVNPQPSGKKKESNVKQSSQSGWTMTMFKATNQLRKCGLIWDFRVRKAE